MTPDRVSSVSLAMASRSRTYSVLVLLFLFQTLNFFDKLVFGLSAVPMMQELSLTPQQYGLIGSSFFLLFSLSGTLVGLFVIGRVKVKWILVILAATWSATQIPIFFTSSVAVLVACRIVLGMAEGPGLPTALHACYDWFPSDRRSVPSAVILQGISIGLLVGSPFLTYVILTYGWHTAFLVCGLLGLGWAALWLVIGGEGPFAASNADQKAPEATAKVPERMLWLDATVVGVIVMSTMSYWIVGMSATWLPPYLQLGLGYSPTAAGWIISGIYLFQSPLLLIGSWLTQTMLRRGWSRRACLGNASGASLLASAVALLVAVYSGGALQLVLIAVAFAAPSLTTIFGPVILGAVAPSAQRGRLIVVIYSANAVSALASNAVTGRIVQGAGTDVPLGYTHAMMFTSAILLIGAIAAFALLFPDRTIARFARNTVQPTATAQA